MPGINKHSTRLTRVQFRAQQERKSTYGFCIAILLFSLLLRLFAIDTIRVDGPSMQPTLYTGEHVMVNKLSATFGKPRRYDVVVCKFVGHDKNYIKRIVALSGETVSVRNGSVYVNGALLPDDIYGDGLRPQDMEELTVPNDCVFVMGDNRDNSADSCVYGPVPHELIIGVAFLVVWPLDSLKFL